MKKLLTILGMLLLAAAFVAPDNAQAQVVLLSSPANASQLTVNSDISVTFNYVMNGFPAYNYQIQVSDQPDFSNIVKNITLGSVTSHTFTGFNPARTYYWRVRAYYLHYSVFLWSQWSVTYNFRIIVLSLLSPSNNATGQSQPLLLDWRGIADPFVMNSGHHIRVDNDADFSSPEINVTTRANEYSVSGLTYNTKFYWKVRYYFTNILTGVTTYYDWSVTWKFTTGCDIPGATALVSPANNATNQSQPVQLDWSTVDIAEDYKIQVAKNSSFISAYVDEYVVGSACQVGGLDDGTTYYWRVAARNECGSSIFTNYRSFTTICPEPDPPSLVSPSNGATGLSMPFMLDWNDVATAVYYGVAIDDNSDFSSPVISEQPSSSQYQVASGLTNGVTYYWRVYVHDNCGNSVWGPKRTFTMECPIPAIPTLELPPNGVTEMSQPVALDWADVAEADNYHLQVDDDPGFGSLLVNASAIVSSSYPVSGMNDATKYYWRVSSINECGESGWSDVRNYTTDCPVLGPPVLSFPANNETGLDVRDVVTLNWSSIKGASGYGLQVASNAQFTSPIIDNEPKESEFSIKPPLTAETWYYWRVATINDCGTGAWGTAWKFQPNCPTAGVPTPESPSNGALSVMQPVELDWADVAEATKYHVQVDDDIAFGSLDVNDENVAVSLLTLPSLLEGVTYNWRISTYNGCQWSDWSDVWSFVPGQPSDIEIVARDEIPESFMLKQNYPNPFNPSTTIEFALPRAGYVTLDIHNILGEKIETLVSRPMSAGSYSVIWDASNIPSGVYFYKIEAGAFSETKKMTLVK